MNIVFSQWPSIVRVLEVYVDENDSDGKSARDNLRVAVKRRASINWLSFGFTFGTHSNTVRPKDSDVRNEEIWRKTLSAALTKEQLNQYVEHLKSRLKSTVVAMILTALQFDLDLPDSQLPIVRRRIEERINTDVSIRRHIESTVGAKRQQLQANDFADILTKEQLKQHAEPTKSRVKSAIVSLILSILQFDLHLPDSQLPAVRKRLEERINPGPLKVTVETAAMHIHEKLQAKDFADVLTEPQQKLWRLTQAQ